MSVNMIYVFAATYRTLDHMNYMIMCVVRISSVISTIVGRVLNMGMHVVICCLHAMSYEGRNVTEWNNQSYRWTQDWVQRHTLVGEGLMTAMRMTETRRLLPRMMTGSLRLPTTVMRTVLQSHSRGQIISE